MKKCIKLFYALGFCALLAISASCTTFRASGLQQNVPSGGYEIIGDFSDREWTNKFLGTSGGTNFFNLSSGATEGVIARAIAKNIRNHGGTGVINLEISYGSNPLQWFLNQLTLHLWAPGTVVLKGTIIKQK